MAMQTRTSHLSSPVKCGLLCTFTLHYTDVTGEDQRFSTWGSQPKRGLQGGSWHSHAYFCTALRGEWSERGSCWPGTQL